MTGARVTALDPAGYRRSPWKNGGGVTIDIADAYRPGAAPGAWDGVIWRLGRTAIVTRGPFSDLTGYDRVQVVVVGRGLVLETPTGEIDVREPFTPVRFRGETPIVSRLEAGPVEVVNLIGLRGPMHIDLRVLEPGAALDVAAGTHVVYAPVGPVEITWVGARHTVPTTHALRIETPGAASVRSNARALLASIAARA
ncbi:MAG: HutD family protein [Proteobacteria bacterium]|nr:HutD family protein [Pseudomonadota bacterium]